MMRAVREFRNWLKYYLIIARLTWQARGEPNNRAKLRRIHRTAERMVAGK